MQDFYVAYELQVTSQPGKLPPDVRSELHQHIQDVFNEFGVQTMSPHIVLQPRQDVLVPQAAWHSTPAESASKENDESRSDG